MGNNNMSDKIEIPLSKKKTIITLISSCLIVLLAYLGVVNPEDFVSPIFRNPVIIRISGIVAVCFFGIGIFFIARKLFDKKAGLIIDEHGITDNTTIMGLGLIEWEDITRIEKQQVMSTKFLILHTSNPEKYIQKAKNFISKRALKINSKTYGSPISITSNSLTITFEDLENLITKEFSKIHNNANNI